MKQTSCFNPRSWSYCEQWISVCHSKEKYAPLHDHIWYLVVLRWSNYRVSSTHEVESSLVLALLSCSSCIIEGKGSHWETIQWLGDVNRKLIDERRRIHRKFRLPGVLAGWASLPHLLSHSFFSVSILKRYCEVEREAHKACFVAPYVRWRTTEREPLNERPEVGLGNIAQCFTAVYDSWDASQKYCLLWLGLNVVFVLNLRNDQFKQTDQNKY